MANILRDYIENIESPPKFEDYIHLKHNLKTNWHIHEICEAMENKNNHRFLLELPRKTGKTLMVNLRVIYDAKYIIPKMKDLRPENRNILIVSYNDNTLYTNNIQPIQELIKEFEPQLLEGSSYSKVEHTTGKRKWNDHRLQLGSGVTIIGRTVGSNMRGLHPVEMFFDDVLSQGITNYTDDWMWRWWSRDCEPMPFGEGKRIFVVGTPMRAGDILDRLSATKEWLHFRFPAMHDGSSEGTLRYLEENHKKGITGKDEVCLFPELQDCRFDELMKCKARDELAFATEYMLHRICEGDRVISDTAIEKCKKPLLYYLPASEMPKDWRCYMGVDLAVSKNKSRADYFVIYIIAVYMEGGRKQYRLVYTFRDKGVEVYSTDPNELSQLRLILTKFYEYKCVRGLVEKNGYQAVLHQIIKQVDPSVNIDMYNTDISKHNMDSGLPQMGVLFSNGQIEIPMGRSPAEENYGTSPNYSEAVKRSAPLIEECKGLVFVGNKVISQTAHDDSLMALWIAIDAARDADAPADISILRRSGDKGTGSSAMDRWKQGLAGDTRQMEQTRRLLRKYSFDRQV